MTFYSNIMRINHKKSPPELYFELSADDFIIQNYKDFQNKTYEYTLEKLNQFFHNDFPCFLEKLQFIRNLNSLNKKLQVMRPQLLILISHVYSLLAPFKDDSLDITSFNHAFRSSFQINGFIIQASPTILQQFARNGKEYFDNFHSFCEEFKKLVSNFDEFLVEWSEYSSNFKYLSLFDLNPEHSKNREIKINKDMVKNKILEIKRLKSEIFESHDDFLSLSGEVEKSEKYERFFKLVYDCEILFIKCGKLLEFIGENRLNIVKRIRSSNFYFFGKVSDVKISNYFKEINDIYIEIEKKDKLKHDIQEIWSYLVGQNSLGKEIDTFLGAKRNEYKAMINDAKKKMEFIFAERYGFSEKESDKYLENALNSINANYDHKNKEFIMLCENSYFFCYDLYSECVLLKAFGDSLIKEEQSSFLERENRNSIHQLRLRIIEMIEYANEKLMLKIFTKSQKNNSLNYISLSFVTPSDDTKNSMEKKGKK